MGANKTYQQKGDRGRMLGESDEFRRLRHAVEKAAGDRERAIRNVCRLYTVNRFDALPGAIRTAMLALLDFADSEVKDFVIPQLCAKSQ
jgi:hypothetical protein